MTSMIRRTVHIGAATVAVILAAGYYSLNDLTRPDRERTL